MKSFLAIFGAVLVTALGMHHLAGRKAEALRRAQEADRAVWSEKEKALEAALANARRQPAVLQTEPAPAVQVVTHYASPEQVLQELTKLRANSRDASIRRVVYNLERLREIGAPALPVIAAYLERFEDVDYLGLREEGERRGGPGEGDRERGDRGRFDFRRGFDVRLSFATSPSLRLGLFDVLQGIGGEEAERILASTLETTGRAVEVAYLDKLLGEMTPNKYRALASSAAKDLLQNPSPAGGGDRLDENAKDYLYHVLTQAGDASFASVAQGMLVTAEGRIDRRALGYLNETMKEQAMPAIANAYHDPRVTNQWEKASLLNLALNYAGPNQQANDLLNSVVGNDQLPAQVRTMALIQLTRGEPTPETLQARLPVVEALKGSTADARMQRSLDITYQNLQAMLAGQKIDEGSWRAAFAGSRGDRGPERSERGGNRAPRPAR